MFADFKKAFKRDESDTIISKSVLEALSDKLPMGLKYVQVDDEYCAVAPEQGNLTIKLKELKMNMPEGFQPQTPDELMEFLYRSQQTLETNSDTVAINGNELMLSEFVTNPFRVGAFKEGTAKFVVMPKQFPDPFPLQIEYEEEDMSKTFQVRRQPLADMHKRLFKSVNNDVLEIKYTIDEVTNTLKFNVHMDFAKAVSVKEIIEASQLYKAFLQGKIKLAGMKLNSAPNEKEEEAITASLVYWKKVQAVSDKLGIQFDLKEEIDDEGALWLDKLYQSLIKNQPYKQIINVNKFTTRTTEPLNTEQLVSEDPMAFQFTFEETVAIYGRTIGLYSVSALLNCKIVQINSLEKDDFKYEIIMEPAYGNGIHQATKHFIDKKDLDEFMESPQKVLEELAKAEDIYS